LFPGVISLLVMMTAFEPGLLNEKLPAVFGLRLTALGDAVWTLAVYSWISLCMVAAWGVKRVESTRFGAVLTPLLLYVVGYGPLLCAITFDAYIKEFSGAAQVWDKTEKVGRVMA